LDFFGQAVFPGCEPTGTASLTPPPRLALSFELFAQGGAFLESDLTATPALSVSTSAWAPTLTVDFDGVAPDVVTFVGPAGSGVQIFDTVVEIDTRRSVYRGFAVTPETGPFEPPSGTWLVGYNGRERTFVVPPPQSPTRLVVPIPTLTVVGGV